MSVRCHTSIIIQEGALPTVGNVDNILSETCTRLVWKTSICGKRENDGDRNLFGG